MSDQDSDQERKLTEKSRRRNEDKNDRYGATQREAMFAPHRLLRRMEAPTEVTVPMRLTEVTVPMRLTTAQRAEKAKIKKIERGREYMANLPRFQGAPFLATNAVEVSTTRRTPISNRYRECAVGTAGALIAACDEINAAVDELQNEIYLAAQSAEARAKSKGEKELPEEAKHPALGWNDMRQYPIMRMLWIETTVSLFACRLPNQIYSYEILRLQIQDLRLVNAATMQIKNDHIDDACEALSAEFQIAFGNLGRIAIYSDSKFNPFSDLVSGDPSVAIPFELLLSTSEMVTAIQKTRRFASSIRSRAADLVGNGEMDAAMALRCGGALEEYSDYCSNATHKIPTLSPEQHQYRKVFLVAIWNFLRRVCKFIYNSIYEKTDWAEFAREALAGSDREDIPRCVKMKPDAVPAEIVYFLCSRAYLAVAECDDMPTNDQHINQSIFRNIVSDIASAANIIRAASMTEEKSPTAKAIEIMERIKETLENFDKNITAVLKERNPELLDHWKTELIRTREKDPISLSKEIQERDMKRYADRIALYPDEGLLIPPAAFFLPE